MYILNRLPTRALSGKTPYEAWSGDKPDLGHVKVFGCMAHMKLPHVHTTKLSDRSKLVVHLGRELGTKGYRLFDPVSGAMHISKDVIFEEKKSWIWDEQTQTSLSKGVRDTFVVLSTNPTGNNEGQSLNTGTPRSS